MKNLIALLYILIVVLIPNSCSKEGIIEEQPVPLIDLSGEWLGKGYQCPYDPPYLFEERVEISHDLITGSIVATKITGDPCVPAGYVTFQGSYFGKDSKFKAGITGGTPTKPGFATHVGFIDVFASDEKQPLRLQVSPLQGCPDNLSFIFISREIDPG